MSQKAGWRIQGWCIGVGEPVYMDVNEVTVGPFKQFVEQGEYSYSNWNDVAKYLFSGDYPMVYVSWSDATA